MGTTLTASLPAGPAVDAHAAAAFDEVARIEAILSTWRPDSELSRINVAEEGMAVPVSPEVAGLLAEAIAIEAATGRAFSPCAGRLIELWDLRRDGRVPPAAETRAAALAIAGGGVRIDIGKPTAARVSAVTIEEGGFAKG
jgi:thiamine biosynthesis lipoprotein